VNRDAPHNHPEHDKRNAKGEIHPAFEAEDRIPDEVDAVVQRFEIRGPLRPLGELSSGKNDPASRKSGGSAALTMGLKFSIDFA